MNFRSILSHVIGTFFPPFFCNQGKPYHMIRNYMKNSIEEIFYKLKAWLGPRFATYGNRANTFSYMFDPIIYDYIFHRSNRDGVVVWTNW